MENFKENDVFKFWFNENYCKELLYPYHCVEGIFFVIKDYGGNLIFADNFWGKNGKDNSNKKFTPEEVKQKCNIEYICNLNDIESIEEWNAEYYDDADIVIISEQKGCRKHFYKFKNAKRNRDKIKNVLLAKQNYLKMQFQSIVHSMKMNDNKLKEIETADLDKFYI